MLKKDAGRGEIVLEYVQACKYNKWAKETGTRGGLQTRSEGLYMN